MTHFRELLDRLQNRLARFEPTERFWIGNAVLLVGAALVGSLAGGLGPLVAAATVTAGNWWLRTAFPDLR